MPFGHSQPLPIWIFPLRALRLCRISPLMGKSRSDTRPNLSSEAPPPFPIAGEGSGVRAPALAIFSNIATGTTVSALIPGPSPAAGRRGRLAQTDHKTCGRRPRIITPSKKHRPYTTSAPSLHHPDARVSPTPSDRKIEIDPPGLPREFPRHASLSSCLSGP